LSSTAEIQTGLAEILEEVAGVAPADATPEKSFTEDLDVDSLSMVEIATAVEETLGESGVGRIRQKVAVAARLTLVRTALAQLPVRQDPDALIVPDNLPD